MSKPQEIFLKDYTTPNYWCEKIDLEVDIFSDHVVSSSKSLYTKVNQDKESSLKLDGKNLEIINIMINGIEMSMDSVRVETDFIELSELPDEFELEIKVKNNPYENLSGEGFYKSGNILCTQCEAEGFRRIMYFQDRPDVMSTFSTTLIADKKIYPRLLSNGNKVSEEKLADGRHKVRWEDPFKKPCYLFAMVAGDLALVEDSFKTSDGRDIKLEIFVDPGNENKCGHAMDSLKASMKWDEDKFGLVYDLDIYMIVAVDSFNMGAMENKGLNIFNSHYVLASKETATDSDFQGVEAVIGHEYFHNWTGNRVTCRDWFQLTLKEGLTVFRDQEFSSDMGSRAVKRIEDVKRLKSHQFPEDAGKLSHPIQPKSYIEINNFYTSTVYEKGAEVIRMIHTLLGERKFRLGMDLYFKRHDGQAVTCADFISAMSDASGVDLKHFSAWYDQNGTPKLRVNTKFDKDASTYTIEVEQSVITNNVEVDSLFFPFYFQLYEKNGERVDLGDKGSVIVSDKTSRFVIENISSDVVPAFNISFSAPVEIEYDYSDDDLQVLMSFAQDEYIRYNATQRIFRSQINQALDNWTSPESIKFSDDFLAGVEKIIDDEGIDNHFKAFLLSPPKVKDIFDQVEKFDFDKVPFVIKALSHSIAVKHSSKFNKIFEEFSSQASKYKLSSEEIGRRSLFGCAVYFLSKLGGDKFFEKLFDIFKKTDNMTIEVTCLRALLLNENKFSEKASEHFYEQWKDETLVIQKWLSLKTQKEDIQISELEALESLPVYDKKIPNLMRALIGSYSQNIISLNNLNGDGYKYICSKVLDVDSYNPQFAARLAKLVNYLPKLDEKRESLLRSELQSILDSGKLSNDCFEIVKMILA